MHIYIAESGDTSLSAATAKTLVQLVTGATRRLKVTEIGVSFNSVTATDAPVLLELLTNTSAGTSSSATIRAMDLADPAAISTALNAFTAEPTGTTATGPGPWRVTPVGGTFVYQFPEGEELVMAVSTRLGLRATSAAAQTGVRAYFKFQE